MMRWIWRGGLGLCLATALAGAGSAEPAKLSPEFQAQLEEGLLRVPVYPVMKQYYPEVYNNLLARAMDGLAQGKTILALQGEIRPTYLALLKAQLPKAEPALVVALLELSRSETEGLVSAPSDCMSFLGLTPFQTRIDQLISPDLAQKELKLDAQILQQTATHPYVRRPGPREPPTAAQMALIAYDELPSDDSRQRFTRLSTNLRAATDPADQRVVCEYMVGFFSALLKQTPEDAAAVFTGTSAKP
ncbi:hypothetical protein [Phenylobacterium sp.]|uniref:hypothetical protein n=1 Tax=Phenylobacterium sp. TaxID=1871053 RepID=UPI003567DE18